MAFPDPAGPPVDYPRPPGNFSLGHYLGSRLTQPGNSVLDPGDWLHAGLHPRAALAAGLASPYGQIATIGVPGARRGEPTAAQQQFLEAIFGSSTRPVDLLPPIGTTNLFDANHPEVRALAKQLGVPASTAGVGGHLRSGYSAIGHIMGMGKGPDLRGGENRMTWNRESTKPGVTELFGKGSGAGRPPPSTVAWLADLIRAINKPRG